MKRISILAAALMMAAATSQAQNLNPTVEVTNAYETGTAAMVKPLQTFEVPDSVRVFNLDFDYSVFDNPYQGAYEFQPYLVQLKPLPVPSDEKSFFLHAGAGYGLHPEALVAWKCLSRDALKVNLTAGHRSYFGAWREISPGMQRVATGNTFYGHQGRSRIGADLSYTWEKGILETSVAGVHLMASDPDITRRRAGAEADLRVRTHGERSFFRNFSLKWAYGLDKILTTGDASPSDHRIDAEAVVAFPLRGGDFRFTAGAAFVSAWTAATASALAVSPYLIPKYVVDRGKLHAELGVRVSYVLKDALVAVPAASGIIFPDVKVEYRLFGDALILHAGATGGDRLYGYGDFVTRDPFLTPPSPVWNVIERVRADAGLRGSIAGRVQWGLRGGYAREVNDPLYQASTTFVSVAPTRYNLVFGTADILFKNSFLEWDASVTYNWTDVPADGSFAPAAFRGRSRAAYNWGNRLQAGVDVAFTTERKASLSGASCNLPGYVDLGVFARFGLTRHLDLWARGGNLLNQTVQPSPFHAEQGIYVSGGINLIL